MPPPLGARIDYAGYRGSIRYVGQVLNSQGLWLGVEWDDLIRGKHNGVKDGVPYFQCL
jgi:dynactin complex subunit